MKHNNKKEKGVYESYVAEKIDEESRLAELLVIKIFKIVVPLFTFIPITYIIVGFINQEKINLFYWVLIFYLLVVMIYHRIVERLLINGAESYIIRFINVGIEITTISIVIINMYRVFGAVAMISGPLVMVYMIMIVMTGFRYSFRLSLFSGIMAAFQHFLLYLYMIREVPDWLYDRLMDFGPSGIIQKSLYILFAGGISSILALYAKQIITNIAIKSIENIEIKNTFGQFVSNEIRDFILSGDVDVSGEEHEGVVVFTNLVNFDLILEKNAPDKIIFRLNEYFTSMVSIISDHNGIVNKFIGDAIMAVFGLKKSNISPEFAAVYCAVEMQKKLYYYNKASKRNNDFTLEMAVGIASGKFIAGDVGSSDRKEFTCMGDVVNVASRLEGVANSYSSGIIISKEVYEKLPDGKNEYTTLIGDVKLKGKNDEVQVYSISIDDFLKKYGYKN